MTSPEIALVAAIVLVTSCLLAYWIASALSRRWEQQAGQQLRQAEQDLEQIVRNIPPLQRAGRQYPPTDPAPYGPAARELHQSLSQIRADYQACCEQLQELDHPLPSPPTSHLRRLWTSLLSEFSDRRQRRAQTGSLVQEVRALQGQIDRAAASVQALRAMPLQAAQRCQALRRQVAGMSPLVRDLRRAGVHGTTFDQAAARAAQLHEGLQELPEWCTAGGTERALEGVTKGSAIRAWQILDRLEAPIRSQRETMQRWRTQHHEIGDSLQAMQRALDQARAYQARVPSSIDAGDRVLHMARLEILPLDLYKLYRAPTIEELGSLQARILPVIERTNELGAFFESLIRAYEHLGGALAGSARLLSETQAEMDALARAAEYPIDWESHRDTLARLVHVRNSIGALTDRRTPERLKEHVKLADDLAGQGHALQRAVDEARICRETLLARLSQLELARQFPLAQQPAWLAQAQDLHNHATRYGPNDWPPELDVSNLLRDAKQLDQRRRQWVPASARTPLPVTQLDARLNEIAALSADLTSFQQRLQQVNERLASLQEAEQAARQELRLAHQAVERLLALSNSATPALGWTGNRCRQQLERTRQASRRQIANLERPGTARVDLDARQVERWMEAYHKALRSLLGTLHADAKGLHAELQEEVNDLQRVASFERERAMQDARALLSIERPGAPLTFAKSSDSAAAQIVSLVDDCSQALQDRENLHIAISNLRAQIRALIERQHVATDRAHKEALAGYQTLLELEERSKGTWPPLQCDTGRAKSLLDAVQRSERALRDSGNTVQDVIHTLDMIDRDCQSLIAETQPRIAQHSGEYRELQEWSGRLERWPKSLDAYRRAHRREPELADAAYTWARDAEREIKRAQKNYRRSPMTVDQARRVLQELWTTVHEREVPVRGRDAPLRARDVEAEFPI